jgi:hypothetical protein
MLNLEYRNLLSCALYSYNLLEYRIIFSNRNNYFAIRKLADRLLNKNCDLEFAFKEIPDKKIIKDSICYMMEQCDKKCDMCICLQELLFASENYYNNNNFEEIINR